MGWRWKIISLLPRLNEKRKGEEEMLDYNEFCSSMEENFLSYFPAGIRGYFVLARDADAFRLFDQTKRVPEMKILKRAAYDLYQQNGHDFDFVMGGLARSTMQGYQQKLEEKRKENAGFLEKFQTFPRENIFFTLENTKNNQGRLLKMPHVEIGDMSKVFHAIVDYDAMKAFDVTNEIAEIWEVGVQELETAAMINTPELFPAESREITAGTDRGAGNSLLLLTNQFGAGGASVICYLELDFFQGSESYFIAPAEQNSAIAIPDNGICSGKDAKNILKKAVEEMQKNTEWKLTPLSGQIYRYDGREKKLTLAGTEEPDREKQHGHKHKTR